MLFNSGKKKPVEKDGVQSSKKKTATPKTSQQTLPYIGVYENGVIEVSEGVFSKSYLIEDVNFKIASSEEQENIFVRFGEFLNAFGPEVHVEISVFNRNIDTDRVRDDILMKMTGDEFDYLREEQNRILLEKMAEGKNNLAHEKYLTATIKAESIDAANVTFARIDNEINTNLRVINNADTIPMTIEDRLSMFYDIYNMSATVPFNTKRTVKGKVIDSFSLEHLRRQGITTKDVVAPSSITVERDWLELDDTFCRVLFLESLPTFLSTEFFNEVTSVPCNLLTSVHFESLRMDAAVKLVRRHLTNINANVIDAQKRASKGGYDPHLIPPDLQKAQQEGQRLMQDITSRNQKMFLTSLAIAVFGDSKEDLDDKTAMIVSIGSKHLCNIRKLMYQQEVGLTTALPLGINKLQTKRLLTTETASLFIPFSTQELSHKNGIYYGLNAVSHNLILFNRKMSANANGIVLGSSGSGKSFASKREILNVLLSTDDDVYIIDPEREYSPLAELLDGEIIRLSPSSNTHLNPFDMDLRYADDEDPVKLKSDFISSLCETIINNRVGLTAAQQSVIDRCVRLTYEPYLAYLSKLEGDARFYDKKKCPTFNEFYDVLMAQPELEAQQIALALEHYTKGSFDTFAHHTNVNTSKRFIVYDILEIGTQMKEMGLQVCLNDIWNKIIANSKQGKRSWFYIDEFYLLTQTDSSARFLQQIFKRARKWGGIPTGITQNVEDMLARPEARSIIENCDFIMMLKQSPIDRIELGNLLGISQTQMSFIKDAEKGQGLIYTGKTIVPFADKYPKDTESYRVMSTTIEDKTAFTHLAKVDETVE